MVGESKRTPPKASVAIPAPELVGRPRHATLEPRGSDSHRGVLTARDLEVASWLERVGAASGEQIGRRFGLGRTQLYRRIQVMRWFGLIRRQRVLAGRPTLYSTPARIIMPAGYEHALALSTLVVELELGGATVLSEIELRRERSEQRRLDGRLGASDLETISRCERLPDAVEILAEGGLRAYEVELSSKGSRRREAAISAYVASTYTSVRWIAPRGSLAALLRAEIARLGAESFMEVASGLGA